VEDILKVDCHNKRYVSVHLHSEHS